MSTLELLKALDANVVTLLGTNNEVKLEQPINVLALTSVNAALPTGKVTDVKLVQPKKALLPKVVTVVGIITLFKLVHW